jgi:hypothetical protein
LGGGDLFATYGIIRRKSFLAICPKTYPPGLNYGTVEALTRKSACAWIKVSPKKLPPCAGKSVSPPAAAGSLFFAHMVKLRGRPFRPANFPALDEYGVTLDQATAAEENAR